MTATSPEYTEAVARFEELKTHEELCRAKLDGLNRMLHRLSPSDHLFGGVLRSISKWSCEQIRTHDALWDALSDVNRCALANSPDRPRLRAIT
ncbi:MAG: hypothetical protein AAGF79_09120 [Pseudomonadota bacterium]